ncbi:unnamed protein product [Calypogeia fissa]
MAEESLRREETIEEHRQRVDFAEILGQLLTNWAADEKVVAGAQFVPQLQVALEAWGVTRYFETNWRRIVSPDQCPNQSGNHPGEIKVSLRTQTGPMTDN